MNTEQFAEILDQKEVLSQEQTNQLANVVEQHPYFQSARALYLKGLKQNHHFSYNLELKKTAARTTDRRILFEYITSEEFNQHQISEGINARLQGEQDKKSETFDEAVKMNKAEADQVLDPNLFETSTKKPSTETVEEIKEEQPKNNLQQGEPLDFNTTEMHSFSEWLKLTHLQKIERNTSEEKNNPQEAEKEKKFNLIDSFIANNPKIVPSKQSSKTNYSSEENGAEQRLMTETLARVYLEQKNYPKAIQAYKILILKNPEKSGLFADRIEEIKKLQENK